MSKSKILEIRVLGGLEIRCDNRRLTFPTRHSALLLAVLALSPGGRIGREACASLLWGDRGDEQARASLRQAIYHAQKVLQAAGAAPLSTSRQDVGLEPDCWQSDAERLLTALQGDPVAAASLYRGELLVGIGRMGGGFDEWVRMESQMIGNRLTAAFASAAKTAEAAGQFDDLERLAAAQLRLDPLNENALRHRMTALSSLNRRPSALKAYKEFETALHQELGVAPEPETADLLKRLQANAHPPVTSQPKAPAKQGKIAPDFRERRMISLVLLRPPVQISDPEEIAQWLEDARSRFEKRLGVWQANLMSPVGASLVAVFGAQHRAEHHSSDAASAALELKAEFWEDARLAVVSGEIVNHSARLLEPNDLTIIAHLVEEAITLADAAQVGQPVVSQAVANRLGLVVGRGAAGVPLREEDLQTDSWQRTLFVARENELAELSKALDETRGGTGRVVGIIGEAGIGKSSLVAAFVSQAQATVHYLEARSREIDRPYSAIAGLFRKLVSSRPEESMDDAIARMTAADGFPVLAKAALQDLLGLTVSDSAWSEAPPGLRRRVIHQLAISILTDPAHETVAILVVEDLHWMDPESLALLDRLIDELTALPLLVIATYRPEFQTDWIGRSFFRLIRLGPITDDEAHRLLGFVLKEAVPGQGRYDAIVERCGGVPYFLVETARAMERGDVLPASIRDVLSAHMQTLPQRDRLVLQCASVIGLEVDSRQLGALAPVPEDELEAALAHLRREELLLRQPGSGAYRFRHALLHDTVYASVPRIDRVRLHSEAMDLCLAEKPEVQLDLVPAVAHHAWHAERWADAVDWCVKAGDRFANLSSYDLASKAYETATEAMNKLPKDKWSTEKHIEIALKKRPVLVPLGRYESALESLERAEETLSAIENPVLSASLAIGKSYLFSTHGRLSEAINCAQEAIIHAPSGHQTSIEAKLALGQALSLKGDWKTTIATLAPTLPFWHDHPGRRFGHTGTRAIWCHGHLSHAYALCAKIKLAADHAEQAFDLATQTGRPLDLIFALHRLGEVYLAKGESDDAISVLEDANARAEEIDAPIFQVWFACDIVPAYLAVGRLEDANPILSRQLTMAHRLNLNQFLAWLELRRAELLILEGNRVQAIELAERALGMARKIPDLVLEPKAMFVKAQCLDDGATLRSEALGLVDQRGLRAMSNAVPE